MLPIILDIPTIIDQETYDDSIKEINKIENQTKAIDTYWKLIKINEDYILPSTAVFWLFFWADTKGKDKARQVFRNVFNISYEDFYNELEKLKPGFKTDGQKNNKDRNNLKVSKKTSDKTLKTIIERIFHITLSDDIKIKSEQKILEEQDAIASKLIDITKEKLDCEIKRLQDKNRKTSTNSYSRKQRNQYLMELYKKKRGYECQFCGKKILKANGNYYIEACHIDAVKDDGTDNERNVLILCPNCHKEFDYGIKEEQQWKGNIFSVKINDVKYEVKYI